ncbi:hypothetical protein GE09DRAFT_1112065 [Coniochaeta sp. 2T2.1]|nr:hypothetical protein GE09DRAFT_1112065 [Coniochaeta sp. 2T2.1]
MAQVFIQYEAQRLLIPLPQSFDALLFIGRAYLSIPLTVGVCPRYHHGVAEPGTELTEANYHALQDCILISFDPSPAVAARGLVNQPDGTLQAEAREVVPKERSQAPAVAPAQPEIEHLWIVYDQSCKYELLLPGKGTTLTGALKDMIAERTGYDADFFDLTHGYTPLDDINKSLGEYNVCNGDTVEADTCFGVAKLAIYLLKPAAHRRNTKLSLRVACIPPFTVHNSHLADDLPREHSYTWDVSVDSDSDWHMHIQSGEQWYRHLSWTGETASDPNRLRHVPDPGYNYGAAFRPSAPSLTPDNATVLKFGDFVPFLEHALETLSLTPEMRSDFILRHSPQLQTINDHFPHVAFRFLPQDLLSTSSTIDVRVRTPNLSRPPVVSRILMLFGGVAFADGYRNEWVKAERTLDAAKRVDWAAQIGLHVGSMLDETKLHVIEVGAMEVPLFK